MKYIHVLASIILATTVTASRAEYNLYHPKSIISLGASYDKFNPGNDLTHTGYVAWSKKAIETEAGGEISVNIYQVDTRQKLFDLLSVDLKAEAKFGMASGSASYTRLSEMTFDDRTVNFVVKAAKVFGAERYSNAAIARLTPLGKKRLNEAAASGKFIPFRKMIGSEVVSSVTKGASISVIYSFRISDKLKKDRIQAKLNAEWASGKAEANILKVVEELDQSMSYQIDAIQIGTKAGAKDILGLINVAPGDVAVVRKILHDAIAEVEPSSGKILNFSTVSISTIDDIVSVGGEEFDNLAQLYESITNTNVALHEKHSLVEARLNLINRFLDLKSDVYYIPDGKEKLLALRARYMKLKSDLEAVFVNNNSYYANRGTLQGIDANLDEFSIAEFFKPPFAKLSKWTVSVMDARRCASTPYDCEKHDFYQNYIPEIDIVHPELISKMTLFRNGIAVANIGPSGIQKIISNNGSLKDIYETKYSTLGIYTWGANSVNAIGDQISASWFASERASTYLLEITSISAIPHVINISYENRGEEKFVKNLPFPIRSIEETYPFSK
jgi:hypothetical protein